MTCYICSNRVTSKTSQQLPYDGYDRTICEKCIAEHPGVFDDLNHAESTNTAEVVKRVILEVAGTIATNGIQDLDKTERGGVSQFGYVRACLMSTAYNALRAMPNFGDSYNAFCNAVLAQVEKDLEVAA